MDLSSVGIVGWRGMVGSVLLERMRAEGDFAGLTPTFYSTSQVGGPGPADYDGQGAAAGPLADAYDSSALERHDVVVSCQGGDYTKQVLPQLRERGWSGYWIDAAREKRMDEDSVIVLDPLNRDLIDRAIEGGTRNFIGGNCTVGLMLLSVHGLFEADLVEWMTCMTYQAASGGGARHMRELIQQMATIARESGSLLDDDSGGILPLDTRVAEIVRSESMPVENFGYPLAASLLPWIDRGMEGGDTREERKAFDEGNKILGRGGSTGREAIPIDSICVRVGAMRCHSQAFTIKLREDLPLDEIEERLDSANEWVRVVRNEKEATLEELTPTRVTGTLDIPIGRVRKLRLGPGYVGAFTVGDQLLWGAAEPLRRVLRILREHSF